MIQSQNHRQRARLKGCHIHFSLYICIESSKNVAAIVIEE
ncbi:hypothetical protein SynROS8604_02697 [Synechococcus sp. ROS8604]|nr:hypothetical protein SynROS8604_02697 [Synechococcus sp. ROS8604]